MKRASARKDSAPQPALALLALPGHCIRRLQQAAVALFVQETTPAGVTPVQYAVVQTLAALPGIDQRTLAREVSFDASTIGGVVDRLEARGLLTRSHSPGDRRVRLLHLTPDGEALLVDLAPSVQRTQQRLLEPLSAAERTEFMRMMQVVIAHHEGVGAAEEPGG